MNCTTPTLFGLAIAALTVFAFELGHRLEARRWRSKAESGFRMESHGSLYTVTKEF